MSQERKDSPLSPGMRMLTGVSGKAVTIISVLMSLYALLYSGRLFDRLGLYIPAVPHRSLILAFVLALCFLLLPMGKRQNKNRLPWYDIILALIAVSGPLYNFFFWERNIDRYAFSQFYPYETILCYTTVLTLLEASRRVIGLAFPLVAVGFLLYTFFGPYVPGALRIPFLSFADITLYLTYQDSGVYGIALGLASTVILMFIIFSRFLFVTGAGEFFINLALSLMGHVRGGPAKVSVVASALFGTVSGSTTANVASTGVFTIPMMKRIGYRPEFAGAVESVASNGGQIMPPVMGMVAFLMAEFLGVSYWSICVAAFVPALLYYIAVFVMVDAEAARQGLSGLPRSECPSFIKTLKSGWIFLLPLVGLVYLLGVLQYSAETSVLYATGMIIILAILKWAFGAYQRHESLAQRHLGSAYKMGISGLSGGAIGIIPVATGCALAGVVIGAMSITQLGLKMADLAVSIAAGNQLVLLMLAAVACFILGMGMSSLPAYIMVVIVVAPALLRMGVPALSSHFFVFWWSLTSFITPPVAMAAYVAAAIAQTSPNKVALNATRLGICTFVLPFMLVYNPALMLKGTLPEILQAVLLALIGVVLLSWGLGGYALKRTSPWQRVFLLIAGIVFMTMDIRLALGGIVLGATTIIWQMRDKLRERRAVWAQASVTQPK
ncbi:MAG: TRAP transporter fused permease subunit [Chloroflexota bacterium]